MEEKNNKYQFICSTCKKSFLDKNYTKNRKFCSRKCVPGTKFTPERKKQQSEMAKRLGLGLWMMGREGHKWTDEQKRNLSKLNKGKRPSPKTEFKPGKDHPAWSGGKEFYTKRRWQIVKNNPRKRMRQQFSCLISTRLKRRLLNKGNKSILEFLPYTIEELMESLEKKFTDSMSWGNYGRWHVDHIIPDIFFNYKSTEDEAFQRCWSLDNLQPMWGIDNIKKGSKLPF